MSPTLRYESNFGAVSGVKRLFKKLIVCNSIWMWYSPPSLSIGASTLIGPPPCDIHEPSTGSWSACIIHFPRVSVGVILRVIVPVLVEKRSRIKSWLPFVISIQREYFWTVSFVFASNILRNKVLSWLIFEVIIGGVSWMKTWIFLSPTLAGGRFSIVKPSP